MAEDKKAGAVATIEPRTERRGLTLFDQIDRDFDDLRRRMRTLFRRPLALPGEPLPLGATWAPTADAYVSDGTLIVKAELPGVQKDDISITVQDGVLTIEGQRGEEKESKDARFYASERFRGSFARGFGLPDGVDIGAITADYRDGVLEVRVPLPTQAQKEATKIPVKG